MAAAGWLLRLLVAAATAYGSCTAGGSSPASASSLDCGTVTSLLAGCKAFVRRSEVSPSPAAPAPGAACCEGVAELYAAAADSADNWRSVCGCMAALVRRYSSNASAIALLPVLCAVLPPAGGPRPRRPPLLHYQPTLTRARGAAMDVRQCEIDRECQNEDRPAATR